MGKPIPNERIDLAKPRQCRRTVVFASSKLTIWFICIFSMKTDETQKQQFHGCGGFNDVAIVCIIPCCKRSIRMSRFLTKHEINYAMNCNKHICNHPWFSCWLLVTRMVAPWKRRWMLKSKAVTFGKVARCMFPQIVIDGLCSWFMENKIVLFWLLLLL